jgi:hypothetical protein
MVVVVVVVVEVEDEGRLKTSEEKELRLLKAMNRFKSGLEV